MKDQNESKILAEKDKDNLESINLKLQQEIGTLNKNLNAAYKN